MENLFKTENIQPLSKNGPTYAGTGEWVERNGESCMRIKPAPFYKNLDDGDTSALMINIFKENTSYIFDFWADADDCINTSTGAYSSGGCSIVYTDGTMDTLYFSGGDNIGFQHQQIITPSNKTIKRVSARYSVNQPVYYRWDSYISEFSTLNINQNGQINATQLVEKIELHANIKKGGSIYCNNFYEN